jgi:hypothetical protein
LKGGNRDAKRSKVGNFVVGGIGPALGRLESLFCAGYLARSHLRAFDHRCLAAKRRGSGFGGRIRRRGQPDGLWSARRGHVSLEGDYLVRHYVHDDFHGADNAHKHVRTVRRQFRVATILEVAQAVGASGSRFVDSFAGRSGSDSCSGDSNSGSTDGACFFISRAVSSGIESCTGDSSSRGAWAV